MEKIKLLIVEDQDDQIEVYEDAIKDFNEANDIQIKYKICKNEEDALEAIKNKNYDAAFIDLSLSNGTSTNEGRNLIDAIQNNARYPIFIVSGQIQDVEHDFNNSFISKHDRAEVNTKELLNTIQNIYNKGITKILNSKGLIETHLNKIFWNQLSESKSYWDNHHLDKENLEKVLSRYTLTHLLEYFQLDEEGREIKVFDPAEMYIKPVIKDVFYPGTLVENDTEKFLILSPACDISNGKCDCMILVKLTELFKQESLLTLKEKREEHIKTFQEDFDKGQKRNYDGTLKGLDNNIKDKLENLISNKSDRYYFLPTFLDFKAKIIDFQDIKTENLNKINSYNKIMTISIYYLKDIQAKFSSYYARQGSPDFDFKSLAEEYAQKFLE